MMEDHTCHSGPRGGRLGRPLLRPEPRMPCPLPSLSLHPALSSPWLPELALLSPDWPKPSGHRAIGQSPEA